VLNPSFRDCGGDGQTQNTNEILFGQLMPDYHALCLDRIVRFISTSVIPSARRIVGTAQPQGALERNAVSAVAKRRRLQAVHLVHGLGGMCASIVFAYPEVALKVRFGEP